MDETRKGGNDKKTTKCDLDKTRGRGKTIALGAKDGTTKLDAVYVVTSIEMETP